MAIAGPKTGEERHSFPGGAQDLFPKTKGYDPKSYVSGSVKVEAAYRGPQFTPDYFHTWQNIVDFNGRRYLFQYDRSEGRVYDVTDVRRAKVVETMTREDVDGDEGRQRDLGGGPPWGRLGHNPPAGIGAPRRKFRRQRIDWSA